MYPLEPPRRGSSNGYSQFMFWKENKKNMYTPAYNTQFCYIKVGYKGVYITQKCYPDGKIESVRSCSVIRYQHMHIILNLVFSFETDLISN